MDEILTRNTEAIGKGSEPIQLAQLPTYLGYQIRQAQIAVFRDLSSSMKDIKLSPGEFSLLTLVNHNSGVSQIALANVYDLDKSTLSHAVKGMVKRGLIIKRRSKDDRRYYGLKLSHSGRVLLDKVTNIVENQEKTMDSILSPREKEQLLGNLIRISKVFIKGI